MSSTSYRSTRSSAADSHSFEEVVLKGLASDGGLFIPSKIPKLPANFVEEWKDLSFTDLAFNILRLYIEESEISNDELKSLIERSYSTFRHEDVTPIEKINDDLYLLELFHGPTYAFKDVALQFVGNLFEFFLQRKNANLPEEQKDKLTVVGATSGDTGSAAIYGLRGKKDVSVFILYPTGRISPIQEAQMTSVPDSNVHTLSVKGTFDDCQDIVKKIFSDVEFNKKFHIGAVNSINWARILAQQTYYFYSYFQLLKKQPDAKVRFVVPSGNFGDILAGYYAKEMGLPADKLIIATNENDILDRFLKTGEYAKSADVKATLSPAMDILISSNFERLLWYLVRNQVKDDLKAGEILSQWFEDLKTKGSFKVSDEIIASATKDFDSDRVEDAEIISTITETYQKYNKYVLDPHTAVGVKVSNDNIAKDSEKFTYISLSTAHPAKFADAVNKALSTIEGYSFDDDVLPQELKELSGKQLRIKLIDQADVEVVKSTIEELLK
ncbi:hypothetical protein WICMUC_002077 [Wickerhamomyces mucosus]|uniref:Threonine synthase n=1 Tax=Wickerhamomyces mucosus TaxID=1378264 RepID=A0A9P8TFG9_9ASCO|nr:hypothetical protein WICMUC_002077 [Wickerhamomyces mucosus]